MRPNDLRYGHAGISIGGGLARAGRLSAPGGLPMLAPFARDIAIRTVGLGRDAPPPPDLSTISAEMVGQHLRDILRRGKTGASWLDGLRGETTADGPALRDVNLEIERGSIVCLAGPSGSGKTTLLKILARRLPPTEGRAELYGRVSSLIAAGDNLSADMTGRENIERHYEVMRVRSIDVRPDIQRIIDFAELKRFVDIPVRRYSSGMKLRLSMALALEGDPDILLFDDVLGVGDIGFQQRCVEQLLAMKDDGCTMVVALSDEELMEQLATRIVTLLDGTVVGDEIPSQRLLGQREFDAADISWEVTSHRPENDVAAFREIGVERIDGSDGAELDIEVAYDLKIAPQRCRPAIQLQRGGMAVFRSPYPSFIEASEPRPLRVAVRLPVHLLGDGDYAVNITLTSLVEGSVRSLKNAGAVEITVRRSADLPERAGSLPLLTPRLDWEIEAMRQKE